MPLIGNDEAKKTGCCSRRRRLFQPVMQPAWLPFCTCWPACCAMQKQARWKSVSDSWRALQAWRPSGSFCSSSCASQCPRSTLKTHSGHVSADAAWIHLMEPYALHGMPPEHSQNPICTPHLLACGAEWPARHLLFASQSVAVGGNCF